MNFNLVKTLLVDLNLAILSLRDLCPLTRLREREGNRLMTIIGKDMHVVSAIIIWGLRASRELYDLPFVLTMSVNHAKMKNVTIWLN